MTLTGEGVSIHLNRSVMLKTLGFAGLESIRLLGCANYLKDEAPLLDSAGDGSILCRRMELLGGAELP